MLSRAAPFVAGPWPGLAAFSLAVLAAFSGLAPTPTWGAESETQLSRVFDPDPLRRFLPPDNLFMPVPGGIAAVSSDTDDGESLEARMHHLHGGLVVGYCLRASCSRVTHLAILQVCNSRIGGLDGSNRLILGVIKLPFGEARGHLMSLQGRNYAENFALHGPYRQDLFGGMLSSGTSLQSVMAEGMGPVAPLQYLGLSIKPQQSRATIALQLAVVEFQQSGLRLPRLEVRHFCEKPMS